jgi:PAS domain S-box-containing protein
MAMDPPRPAPSLDAETLDYMFPCRFALDGALTIRAPAASLAALAPQAADGIPFAEVFKLQGPRTLDRPSDLAGLQRTKVVLVALSDPNLQLRGLVAPQPDGGALFLVSPVVTDAATARRLGANLDRLSPCDDSAELLIAMEMQRILTDEAKELAKHLASTRDQAVIRQAFFDTVLQLLPAMVVVKDARDGRYLLFNRMAQEVLGASAGDMIGRTCAELLCGEQAARAAAEDAEVIASPGLCLTEEAVITTPSGETRYLVNRKLATFGEHGAEYIVTLGEDVTERRKAASELQAALAAAEQASLSKGAFLANMSHEIRTPLNGIVAVADVLSRSNLGAREREMVRIVQASGATLERLLSDILDLARVESQQIDIEQAPFHLAEMLRATAALARMRADEKGLPLDLELDPAVDLPVIGDMVRVRQVLTNLLSNAVKFTEKGRVLLRASRAGGTLVRFTVDDTGVGFGPDARARIFGRFQQADDTITRRFGGSGLGLAISRELVDLMGGRLDCESAPGCGASFVFEIQLPPSPEALPGAPDEPQSLASAGVPRVLVADDHPTNRKVVELMLEGLAELTCVENGAEAVRAYRAGPFDLVLMDMQMPVMDGLSAVREIRRLEAGAKRAPIIMLTANALPEHIAASLAAGADLHLEKPVIATSLFRAINEVTRQAEPVAAAVR